MSQKKRKKRHSQAAYDAKNWKQQEQLADERIRHGGKPLDPTARNLLLIDLVLLAVVGLLTNHNLISNLLSSILSIVGIILMFVALWCQFGKKRKGNSGDGPRIRL